MAATASPFSQIASEIVSASIASAEDADAGLFAFGT
jgi:hypothetical protein